MKNQILLLSVAALSVMLFTTGAMASTVTIRPNAQGYYSAWTSTSCGTGSNQWQCVDEASYNTTDTLKTTSTQKDTFNFSDTGLSGVTINSVTLYYYAQWNTKAGDSCFNALLRNGSTDNTSASAMCTNATWGYKSVTYAANPFTRSAWTVAAVDALQAGMVGASTNGGGIVAQVYAVVDYTQNDVCSDTDGGNVITVYGTTSGYIGGSPYSHNDYCVDTSSITEYYCSGTSEQSSSQSCGTDGYTGSDFCQGEDVYQNYTDYSCASGACGSSVTPQLMDDCSSYNGYTSGDYCIGNAVYKNYTSYSCSSGACGSSTTAQLQQNCSANQYCSAGACYYSDSCSDTDGGDMPAVWGYVSGYHLNSPYNFSDFCYDTDWIGEYTCYANYKVVNDERCGTDGYVGDYFCMNGDVYRNYTDSYCMAGACGINNTSILQQDCVSGQYCSAGVCMWSNSCSDTDGGNKKNVFGTTSGYYNNNPYSHDDFCADSSNIVEFYCNGTSERNSTQSCGTDGYFGSYYCTGNNRTRNYVDFGCASGACGNTTTPTWQQNCDLSDGWNGSAYCQSGDVYRNFNDYYCGSGYCYNNLTSVLYQDCVSGQYCSGGACHYNNTCGDTDGGYVIGTQGTASGYFNDTSYSSTDFCQDSDVLVEYFCGGTLKYSYYVSCSNTSQVCTNGACV
jgi:hypothetical protein